MPKNTTGSDGTVKAGGILAGCTNAVMNTECKRGELVSKTEDSEAVNTYTVKPLTCISAEREAVIWTSLFLSDEQIWKGLFNL